MRIAHQLIAFGLKQVLGEAVDKVSDFLDNHFNDHAGALPKALARAHDRAWDALGVALAGDGFLDQIKRFFTDADAKGLREQVRVFLATNTFDFVGATTDFKRHCLTELKAARKAGKLAADNLTAAELRQPVADFRRYTEDAGLLNGARAAVAVVADQLAEEYPHLARLLGQPTPAGPPLLAAAFAYFFRREVQTNAELARGLHFELLQRLYVSQSAAFAGIGGAVERLGGKVEEMLDGLDRIEGKIDILIRQFAEHNHVRAGEMAPRLTVSITNEQERELLKRLRDEYRKLPAEQQNIDSLMLLADSLSAAGQFGPAQELRAVAVRRAAAEKNSREAEAQFKTYRDACEQGQWDAALPALLEAARLDPARFRPFPLKQYVPQQILGAGGFGTVVKCEDRYAADKDRIVAVKTLHTADLSRDVQQVFAEAHTLHTLNHPAIIDVRSWNFADENETRPFIVMEYFHGLSLGAHLRRRGKLAPATVLAIARQVASAMKAAHGAGVLHRDLKPDNILVRKTDRGLDVRVIDFGLAVRQQAASKSVLCPLDSRSASDRSYAGTFKYAPPEQKGESKEPVGPYSDVYTFGKTCYEALFRMTDPKSWDFDDLPAAFQPLARLLERCTATPVKRRPSDFGPILEELEALDQATIETKRRAEEEIRKQRETSEAAKRATEALYVEEEARKKRESEAEGRKQREQEEAEKRQPEDRRGKERIETDLVHARYSGEPSQQQPWMSGGYIGIDFGISNSVVACFSCGQVGVIPNHEGQKWTPSVVTMRRDGTLAFGTEAKENFDEHRSIRSIKRILGTPERVPFVGQNLRTEQIAVMLFSLLKKNAEMAMHFSFTKAVVTIPANSKGLARHATKLCAGAAGLHVLTLINEPTAAAICYGINAQNDQKVLVYDFGGGTLDVTILHIHHGIFEEVSSKGIGKLGGDDVDVALGKVLGERFQKKTGYDILNSPYKQQFMLAVEQAKMDLSSERIAFARKTNIVPELHLNLEEEIDRVTFERMIMPLVVKSGTAIDEAMKLAGCRPRDIDTVLLVGGMSMIPVIRRYVSEKLAGKEPESFGKIDPRTCVAQGAAIVSAILQGAPCLDNYPYSVKLEHSLCVPRTDPRTGRVFLDPIIKRGQDIPCSVTQTYYPETDPADRILISVYEGDLYDNPESPENVKLAEIPWEFKPPRRRHEGGLNVTFEYGDDGILTVQIKDGHASQQKRFAIQQAGEDQMNASQLIKMKASPLLP